MNETSKTETTPAANGTALVPAPAAPPRQLSEREQAWVLRQRQAKAFSDSNLVPEAYRGNIPNVLIAIEMAERIDASVFAVMQNLDVIHGRPSFRAQFLIASVNASKRFTPLRFQFQSAPGSDDWGARCVAKDAKTGEECLGPLVTIATAKAEGWYSKNGSKWKTLPELMICYRAAGFWTRLYAPEMSLGMLTTEEVLETASFDVTTAATSPRALESAILAAPALAPKSLEEDLMKPKAAPAASSPKAAKGEAKPKASKPRDFEAEAGDLKQAVLDAEKDPAARAAVTAKIVAWTSGAPPELADAVVRFARMNFGDAAIAPTEPAPAEPTDDGDPRDNGEE